MLAELAAAVKQCRSLSEAKQLHSRILHTRFTNNTYLSNLLIRMYARCGSLDDARFVFQSITSPDTFSFNILLQAYAAAGHLPQSCSLFQQIPCKDVVSWTTILRIHARFSDLITANEAFHRMPCWNLITWNTILAANASNANLRMVRELFDKAPERDPISWSTLLQSYADACVVDQAIAIHDRLPQLCIVSETTMITIYAQNGQLQRSRAVFDSIPEEERNIFSHTAILSAYATLGGGADQARALFDVMPERNVVACTALLGAYARGNDVRAARWFLMRMPQWDAVCWAILLNGDFSGEESFEIFIGMPSRDVVSWNTLLVRAQSYPEEISMEEVFHRMPQWDSVSWNTAISVYAQKGHIEEAVLLNECMAESSVLSWNAMIQVYGRSGLISEAEECFTKLPARSLNSWSSLVAAYALNGLVDGAEVVLDSMPEINSAAVCVMISAYARAGQIDAAESVFDRLKSDVAAKKTMAFAYVVNGLHQKAKNLFIETVRMPETCGEHLSKFPTRISYSNISSWNSILSAFATRGSLEQTKSLFDATPSPSSSSWNSIIVAYSLQGEGCSSITLYYQMILEGFGPDPVTFMHLFGACAHVGLISLSTDLFSSMQRDHHRVPTREHYYRMIDVLSRAGEVEQAEVVVENLPFEPDDVAWMTILAASRVHGHVECGSRAACRISQLQPHGAACVLLSNIFGSVGRREEAAMLRRFMVERCMRKVPGLSLFDSDAHFSPWFPDS